MSMCAWKCHLLHPAPACSLGSQALWDPCSQAQPVPTLSSLLTFLGYSGSCQRAQPAEPFAPCSMVASSPVGSFSQTLFTWHLWLGQGQGLRVVKTLESVHGVVGTGHAGALAWQGFKFPGFPAPAQLCESPNTGASCITILRFLPALALLSLHIPLQRVHEMSSG